MSIRSVGYWGAAICLAVLVSGCSSSSTKPSKSSFSSSASSSASRVSDECKPNRSKCLYNGSYEPGERDYAEAEAKRLNLAESERLRRAFGN